MTPDAAGSGRRPAAGKPPRTAGERIATRAELRSGETIALVAAILLFILMFFDWSGKSTTGTETGSAGRRSPATAVRNAWQALEVIPLFLILAIVVAVGAALLRVNGSDWKPAIPPGAAVCVLGILGGAADPDPDHLSAGPGAERISPTRLESTLQAAVFLALVAAARHRLRRLAGDGARKARASPAIAQTAGVAAAPAPSAKTDRPSAEARPARCAKS